MPDRAIRFIYFDMGNVLLHFDHRQGCRHVAGLTGLDAGRVYELIFDSGLATGYETGDFDSAEMHRRFCAASSARVERLAFLRGISDIFTPNDAIVPIVERLHARGHRLGVLSNTCDAHWDFVTTGLLGPLLPRFEILALSYELGAMKPDPAIYRHAARLAGVEPREILFIDDREDNIAAAYDFGFDAIQYTSVPALESELARRGL